MHMFYLFTVPTSQRYSHHRDARWQLGAGIVTLSSLYLFLMQLMWSTIRIVDRSDCLHYQAISKGLTKGPSSSHADKKVFRIGLRWHDRGLNAGPSELQSAALPTELSRLASRPFFAVAGRKHRTAPALYRMAIALNARCLPPPSCFRPP